MYKIRRFSKINPNVYQRDYSRIGDLGKKYKRNQSKVGTSISRFHRQTHVNNPRIENKLLREDKKNNARTIGVT